MAFRTALFFLAVVSGCGTVHVQYPAGLPRPKIVTIQLYASLVHDRSTGRDVRRYNGVLAMEAGCLKAAMSAGQAVSVYRGSTSSETESTITFFNDSIDPRRAADETGADAIITGTARLTPRSARVEELTMEAVSPGGRKLAQADFSNGDGAEPFEAGEQTCRELFRGWGPPTLSPAPRAAPRSVYVLGGTNEPGEALRDGCAKSVQSAGLKVIASIASTSAVPRGYQTVWKRLAWETGADSFIATQGAFPLDGAPQVAEALVWLTDASGIVQNGSFFDGAGSVRDPASVGLDLCRKVLAGPR